jgi:hypothetical protein
VRGLAVVLVAVLALSACGGGSGHKTASDEDQIKSAYVTFFSGKASFASRLAVLQNATKFKPVFDSFANNPLARNTSARVKSVTLQGANKAKVVFSVTIGGTALPQQTGAAVRQGGKWKVADASICRLVALGGATPSVCRP